mmetsp:Transcript_99990/g.164372  ORF Transcript_99990/g.164372 Transcript_99990/m.164372 type:complete len:187 (-) Transcript_99990:37-597(-)
MILWHLDMFLYNLFLRMHERDLSLTAIDYSSSEMCCIDSDCDSLIDNLAESMKDIKSHVFGRAGLRKMIAPCSSFSAARKADLDRRLIEAWVRDNIALFVEDGYTLVYNAQAVRWDKQTIRGIYWEQWFERCGESGQKCKDVLHHMIKTYDKCEARHHVARLNPEWSSTTQDLLKALREARGSLGI